MLKQIKILHFKNTTSVPPTPPPPQKKECQHVLETKMLTNF